MSEAMSNIKPVVSVKTPYEAFPTLKCYKLDAATPFQPSVSSAPSVSSQLIVSSQPKSSVPSVSYQLSMSFQPVIPPSVSSAPRAISQLNAISQLESSGHSVSSQQRVSSRSVNPVPAATSLFIAASPAQESVAKSVSSAATRSWGLPHCKISSNSLKSMPNLEVDYCKLYTATPEAMSNSKPVVSLKNLMVLPHCKLYSNAMDATRNFDVANCKLNTATSEAMVVLPH
jgi:hypothetical protein